MHTLESVASNSMVDGSKTTDLLVVQRVHMNPGITGNSRCTQNFEENWVHVLLGIVVIVWC